MRDKQGQELVFIVYDKAKRTPDGRLWRIATFRDPNNADSFLADKPSSYFVSCNSATVPDLRLARD